MTEPEYLGRIIPFRYADHSVRAVNQDGKAWVSLTDLCEVLKISSPRRAAERLDDDEKIDAKVETGGGRQYMSMVNRSGMYHLVFTSRVEGAVRFRKWLTNEVLASIEDHGFYLTDEAKEDVAIQAVMFLQTLEDIEGRASRGSDIRSGLDVLRQQIFVERLEPMAGAAAMRQARAQLGYEQS